jgi:hypothetical protein
MSFFSRGSNHSGNKGNKGRRGRVPNIFQRQGRNKKIRFLIHFDSNSKEFNPLVQTGYLNFGGHPAWHIPQAPIDPPLQLHPSIAYFSEPPPMQIANDGWENIPSNPPSDIVQWPDVSLPPPPHMHPMPHVSFVASMAHSIQVPINYKELFFEHDLDKGKQPTISLIFDSSKASSIQSRLPHVQPEDDERKITFNDMQPKMSRVEENKYVDPDLLKHRDAIS